MVKPNFKENRKKYKKFKEIRSKLAEIKDKYKVYEQTVIKDARRLLDEQIVNELKKMPVDELSKARAGIRISALKKAGIKNVYQLSRMSESNLLNIRGVGDYTAEAIVSVVKDIKREIEENTHLKIDKDNPSKNTVTLVRDLFLLRKYKHYSEDADSLLPELNDAINQMKKETAPARSWVVWILSPEDKKKYAVEKFDDIAETAESQLLTQTEEKFAEEKSILKAEHDVYWADYIANAAGYYASLENAIDKNSKSKEKEKSREEKIADQNGLPPDLAIAISQVDLNLQGLKCELRKYQKYGVQYILNQGAVLLGDEMGLGKTIEAIATMVSLANNGATHFLVVCPASVLINWTREIEKFSELNVRVIHGSNNNAFLLDCWQAKGGVALTTYETLSKISLGIGFKYDLLVVDEAHYVKNPHAARTRNLLFFRQHTDRVLFMTGTPLENRVSEMIFLVGCLQPKVGERIKDYKELSMAPEFRRKISGVYFRRTKEDVLEELPQKTEIEEWCKLEPKEHALYGACVGEGNFMAMRQVSWMIDEPGKSSKGKRLKELVKDYLEVGRKVIVFSFFINTIDQVKKILGDMCYGPITGSISPVKRQEIIDQFSAHKGGAVLLSQIQAGGTGLNVQAASVVIICEPQLKPSIENQAIARAYRMGQVNRVMVHRLLCEKTVDEQIINALKNKQLLFDNFADKSESGQESLLDSTAIKKMVEVEKQRYAK